jgi:hypothetical protein
MAQTTPDASFGPIFSAAAQPSPPGRLKHQYNLRRIETLLEYIQNKKQKRKPQLETI